MLGVGSWGKESCKGDGLTCPEFAVRSIFVYRPTAWPERQASLSPPERGEVVEVKHCAFVPTQLKLTPQSGLQTLKRLTSRVLKPPTLNCARLC